MSTTVLCGGCLCGAVKYRVTGNVLTAVNCHCSMCRKAHGAAFRPGAIVKLEQLTWEQGEDLLADYRSSAQMHRIFCRACGSHMIARSDAHPTIISVALGTTEGNLPFSVAQHWNVASKAPWFEITDELLQFPVTPGPR